MNELLCELRTLLNNTSGERLFMCHTVSIPPYCPVSRNPREGSTLTICYRARVQVLEVASLYAYLHRFVNGLRGPDGSYEVRDMEGLLSRVAADCAQALGVPVRLSARLQILPRQQVCAVVRGYPASEVSK